MKVLIVKTSSLGDIIQSFCVLDALKMRFPNMTIDWAVESSYFSLVASHPLVHKAISLNLKKKKNLFQNLKTLREEKYDLIFDLQGNIKSGLITFLAKGKEKVGFGLKSVREWPNILATNTRFNVSKKLNIREFYLSLISLYFKTKFDFWSSCVTFKLTAQESLQINEIVSGALEKRMMVCPGSRWENKRLDKDTLIKVLKKIEAFSKVTFFLVWGNEKEKEECEEIATQLQHVIITPPITIAMWQNLMVKMDLVLCVDSSALHLSSTTNTPSFSLFGPTSSKVFKPLGDNHLAIQGICPYGKVFDKQCPSLRSCPTGACIKSINADSIFNSIQNLLK